MTREGTRGIGTRRALPLALAAIFLLAIVWVQLRAPDGIALSADPGAGRVAGWMLPLPALVGLAVIRLLPPRVTQHPPQVVAAPRMRREVWLLLACAVVFPIVARIVPLPEDYVLAKAALLIILPFVVLWWSARKGRGRSVSWERAHGPGLPWLALLPVAVYTALSQFGPLAPGSSSQWPDLTTLLIAATATALTAGVGEEFFYRYWLQTRLEALIGPASGLLIASLLFGLMHLGSHGAGLPWDVTVASVIAGQGTFGLFVGYLWQRYRRLWPAILAHLLANGLMVVLYLLGVI